LVSRNTAGAAFAFFRLCIAIAMPRPLSASVPAASISIVPCSITLRSCAAEIVGTAPFTSAAIAPACGAAAEVPKNGLRPEPGGSVVETPSAAARSGLLRTSPPPLANVTPPWIGWLLRS
jgi:hypothetical protein